MTEKKRKEHLKYYSPTGAYDGAIQKMVSRLEKIGGAPYAKGIELAAQYHTVRFLEHKGELDELDSVQLQAKLTDERIEILKKEEAAIKSDEEVFQVEIRLPKNTINEGKRYEVLRKLARLFNVGEDHLRFRMVS